MSWPAAGEVRAQLSPELRQALDSLTASLQNYLAVQHNSDGTHALGLWVQVPFSAQRFTGNQVWTVTNPNVVRYAYTKIGKTMTLAFNIVQTTVGGGATQLRIAIPDGFLAAAQETNTFSFSDNGTAGVGMAFVTRGAAVVTLVTNILGTVNWTAAAATTAVAGQITFEVQ